MQVKEIVKFSKFVKELCGKNEDCGTCPLCIAYKDMGMCGMDFPEAFEQLMAEKHITEIRLEVE